MTKTMMIIVLGCSILISTVAQATVPFKGPFWHFHSHGGANGANVWPGCCCWALLTTGIATPAELAAGDGNLEAEIILPDKVHFVFHTAIDLSPYPDSALPIDTAYALSSDVSQALGYSSIVFVPGNYPVDFSHNQYGETTIEARLSGPIIPTLAEWGAIFFGTLLLGSVLYYIWRRRRVVTA